MPKKRKSDLPHNQAAAPKKRACIWKQRQKAVREMQACERISGACHVLVKQFSDDAGSVTVRELTQHNRQPQGRLDEKVRCVYLGEDLQEPWAGDEDEEELAAEQMERAKRFEAIRAYRHKMSLLIPAVTCNVATEEKDPENYDVRCSNMLWMAAFRLT